MSTPDPGAVALSILRLLTLGPRSLADVQAALSMHATPRVAEAAERLKADGLVQTKWKRLELTPAGRKAAPSPTHHLASHGRWLPPKVVLRAGSCTKHIPSRYGDALVYGGRI